MKLRTHPLASAARGVPIVGQRQQPPEGVHFYQVPVLVQRPGEPLEADTFEIQLAVQMRGVHVQALQEQLARELKEKQPERPEPRVILLAPFYLGFVTKEELEAAAASVNGGDRKDEAATEGVRPC